MSSLRPRRKPSTSSGLDDEQGDALGPFGRIGLGDDDDEIGDLAVGDEGLGAVDPIAVAVPQRGRPHRLQVGAGAGLAHRDRGDALAGDQLGQPLMLLPLGGVGADVGQDDRIVEAGGEAFGALADHLLGDHRIVPEIAAMAAIGLRDADPEQAALARLAPEFALDHPVRAPLRDPLRRRVALEEAADRIREHAQFLVGHVGGRCEIGHGAGVWGGFTRNESAARRHFG